MARERGKDKGQDLVEYAIVFPALMLLLLGIVEFGRIMYSYNAISNAAREGARWAVVPGPDHQDEIDDVTQDCPGSNKIIQQVCSRALALPGRLTVTISQEDADGRPDSQIVRVGVEYSGPFLTNLLLEAVSPSGLVLRAAATMRLE